MSVTVYKKTILTGGTSTCLDSIDGALLLNEDMAFVDVSNIIYIYILDDDLGGAESSPDIITPDTNPGNKRWVLQGARLATAALSTDLPVTEGGTGRSTATTAYGLLAAGTTATGTQQTLAAGVTTEVLVGGGAAALPVWTTATGSGAPVRATSPTLVTPLLGTPTSGTLTNCTTATASDNDADTSLASTAFAKAEDAVLKREPDQAVNLTAAASGSSGILITDSPHIDTGTGNFFDSFKVSIPTWLPGANTYFVEKRDGAGYFYHLNTSSKLRIYLNGAGGLINDSALSVVFPFVAGTEHHIVISVARETTSVAGSAAVYTDGVLFETVVISAGSGGNMDNAGILQLMGHDAIKTAGTITNYVHGNRALTAAEVLDLYRNGVAYADFDSTGVSPASHTAQTSGSLVVGKRYRIDDWITNDDFTNVGGANVDGTEFIATGTTPTTWTNSSSLRRIGATLYIPSRGWQPDRPIDFSGNALAVTYPNAGWSLTQPWSYATLQAAANNAAAAGLTIPVPVGGLYRTNADPSVICVRTV